MPNYKSPSIQELAKQLAYSPEPVRRQMIDRAEKLVGLLDPRKVYPYEFICYQITGYRPRTEVIEALAETWCGRTWCG